MLSRNRAKSTASEWSSDSLVPYANLRWIGCGYAENAHLWQISANAPYFFGSLLRGTLILRYFEVLPLLLVSLYDRTVVLQYDLSVSHLSSTCSQGGVVLLISQEARSSFGDDLGVIWEDGWCG